MSDHAPSTSPSAKTAPSISTLANTAADPDMTSNEDKGNLAVTAPSSHDTRVESQSRTASEPEAASGQREPSTEKATAPQQPDLSGVKRAMIIFPATLVYFLVMLDSSIISTAIPQITDEFDSLLDVGWYGSAYQLASSAFVPLAGKIYSFFPIKWSFIVFFAVFELGSALCGAAQSSPMLIVGRAIAGLGASGLMNGILTILAAILPPHKLPRVTGLNVALGQVGLACGPLIGGALTEYATWRWCFYINLPVGALVGVLLLSLRIPEIKAKPPAREVFRTAVSSMDLFGLVLLWPAAIMFFLALQWGGNQYAWNSATVIGLFVGAAVTLGLFLWWEHHYGDNALLPFSMLRARVIYSASATMFFFMGVMLTAYYYLPIYFQVVKGDSPLMSGVHILPSIISQVLVTMSTGTLIQRVGYYLPNVLTGTALASIAYGLYSTLSPSTSVGKWIGYQIIGGAGSGATSPGSYIAIQNSVARASIPTAMAILILCQNLGSAVFLTVAQSVFSNSLQKHLRTGAPGVDAQAVVQGGARMLRHVVPAQELPAVLQAYSRAIDAVMYLGAGLGVAAFGCAWGLGFKDIRKKGEAK